MASDSDNEDPVTNSGRPKMPTDGWDDDAEDGSDSGDSAGEEEGGERPASDSDEAEAIAEEGAEAALIAASGEFSAQHFAASDSDIDEADGALVTDAQDYDESTEGKTHLVLLVLAIVTAAILVVIIWQTKAWDPNVCESDEDCRGLKECIENYCVNPEIWERQNGPLPSEGSGS